jgi:phospholipid transport system substrate-binding protein
MVRISTGAAWRKMSEAEQSAVLAAFSDWTVANYAGNFGAWDGENFETKSQSPDDGKGNAMVNTQLNVKGMPPVLFNYRLHKADNVWKIFDIYLDGAISQLAMRRAEFAAVLARGTSAELIAHMKKLTKDAEKGVGTN